MTADPGMPERTDVPPTAESRRFRASDTKIGAATDRLSDVLTGYLGRIERKVDTLTADIALVKEGLGLDGASPAEIREAAGDHRQMRAGWNPQHPVEPHPHPGLYPVFDGDGRETGLPYGGRNYPLRASCRCGRQITQAGPFAAWEHCD